MILTGIPHGSIHNGGRLFFAANGSLFVTCGESGNKPLAQNKASLGGKVLRIDRDGNPWPTNPFIGTAGDDRIYSCGHRNPQGIDQAADGRMWACQLGQNTWDELNQIAPGRNYGWATVEGPDGPGGFVDPLVKWHPADCSPSGMAIRGGYAYIGALRGQSLWRVDIRGAGLRSKVRFFHNTFGRIRTVMLAPDDSLVDHHRQRRRHRPGDQDPLRGGVGTRHAPVALPVVAGTDFDSEIKQLQATMKTIGKVLDLDAMRSEIADLGEQVAAPDLWDDQANATRVTGRLSALQGELDRFTALQSRIDDLELMVEMAREESDADALADAEAELARLHKPVEKLEVRTLLSGEYDAREAIVSIRSGAGGVDAADFAEMLMRMYTRWAERNKYPVEVFDTSYAEEAGLKSATFAVHAPYAYGTLSVEAGTHRLVRISPFDNQGRRQTSFAAVEVVPVLEQTDEIDIPEEDDPRRRLPLVRPGRPVGEHDRLRRTADPHPHRHRRVLPEREVAAAEQGLGDGDPQGQAARAEEGRGEGPARRAARRRAGLLGRPDAQLRAEPVPDGQGPAHRVRVRQPAVGA